MEGEHEAEVMIPKLKVVILNSELKMKVVKSFIMLAHHQFNLLFPLKKDLREEKESKDFGPFNIIWTPHREDMLY